MILRNHWFSKGVWKWSKESFSWNWIILRNIWGSRRSLVIRMSWLGVSGVPIWPDLILNNNRLRRSKKKDLNGSPRHLWIPSFIPSLFRASSVMSRANTTSWPCLSFIIESIKYLTSLPNRFLMMVIKALMYSRSLLSYKAHPRPSLRNLKILWIVFSYQIPNRYFLNWRMITKTWAFLSRFKRLFSFSMHLQRMMRMLSNC
jgi:hypothetical protein